MGAKVEHPSTHFGQWIPNRSDLLIGLESEAEEQDIPIVGPVVRGQVIQPTDDNLLNPAGWVNLSFRSTVNHLRLKPKAWGPRIQGFEGSSEMSI